MEEMRTVPARDRVRPRVPPDRGRRLGQVGVGARHDRARRRRAPAHTEGVMVDITERKLAEARAQHYLDVAGTILLVLRMDQTVELLNRHGRELIGYEEGELIGRDWYDLVVPEEDRAAAARTSSASCPARASRSPTTRATSSRAPASGARSPGATRCCATRAGEIVGVLASGEDITERLRAEEEISRLAYYDPLTGLPNRRPARGGAAPLRQPLRALRPRGRAAARRPRQLQARQRLLRPRRGRPAAAADRRPPARDRGRQRACSRASAATSS